MDALFQICVTVFVVYWIKPTDCGPEVPAPFTTRPTPVTCYDCAYISVIKQGRPITGLRIPYVNVKGAERLPQINVPSTVANTRFCYLPLRPESRNVRRCTSQNGTCMKLLIKTVGLQVAQRTCVPATTTCPPVTREVVCKICNSHKCNNGKRVEGGTSIFIFCVSFLMCFFRTNVN